VVVVVAHIGSKCKDVSNPEDDSTCDHAEEIYPMLAALPAHTVDVVVAGHTHAAIAHRIAGVAVIESYSSGRAFGRVDLRVEPDGHVGEAKIFRPTELCKLPCDYEGKPVTADHDIQAIVDDALARAGERRGEKLGVTLAGKIARAYGTESAEGDLFTDLMLAAQPKAQVALTNGGGLRADLPAGDLTYGALFEAMPFDNKFALVDVHGADLKKLVIANLERGGAIFSWGGLAAKVTCTGDKLAFAITVAGKPLADAKAYTLVTSDFIASGGDGVMAKLALPKTAVHMTDAIVRDGMADVLRKQRGTIDPARFKAKRLAYAGRRPVSCSKQPTEEPPGDE
jgi:5'-nucleotidase